MLSDSRHAGPGTPPGENTETAAFLQTRLGLLHQVLFILSGAILCASTVLLGFLYSVASALEDLGRPHRLVHLALTVLYGISWQISRRYRLREKPLLAIDAVGIVGTAITLAYMVSHANSGRTGATELVAALMFVLSTRAVIIPSTARQTLILCVLSAIAAIAVFTWNSLHHPIALPHSVRNDPRDNAATMALWLAMMTASATIASRVIYGLRKEVRAARRVGQYELLEKIGEGGMGVVYRARHALLRRETALKLLPQATLPAERQQRFEREVRLTARLSHPNTVSIFDYGRTPDGVFYYAMEYLDGLDLERLVAHAGALPVGRVAHLLRQILLSLTEAHELGLIHRDIKPANVILTERGGEADVVKVVDFGLVKDLHGAEAGGLTAAGGLTGTPLYMPPEAVRASDEAGAAGDLYAAAAVAYYLLTGTHVFSGATIMEICAHHLHTPPVPPSERLGRSLPPDLENLILAGLAKAPAARPASARAFRAALEACAGIPPWTEADARAWWDAHRGEIPSLRQAQPVSASARTVAVDLRERAP